MPGAGPAGRGAGVGPTYQPYNPVGVGVGAGAGAGGPSAPPAGGAAAISRYGYNPQAVGVAGRDDGAEGFYR